MSLVGMRSREPSLKRLMVGQCGNEPLAGERNRTCAKSSPFDDTKYSTRAKPRLVLTVKLFLLMFRV